MPPGEAPSCPTCSTPSIPEGDTPHSSYTGLGPSGGARFASRARRRRDRARRAGATRERQKCENRGPTPDERRPCECVAKLRLPFEHAGEISRTRHAGSIKIPLRLGARLADLRLARGLGARTKGRVESLSAVLHTCAGVSPAPCDVPARTFAPPDTFCSRSAPIRLDRKGGVACALASRLRCAAPPRGCRQHRRVPAGPVGKLRFGRARLERAPFVSGRANVQEYPGVVRAAAGKLRLGRARVVAVCETRDIPCEIGTITRPRPARGYQPLVKHLAQRSAR